jgi:hypothetical protein
MTKAAVVTGEVLKLTSAPDRVRTRIDGVYDSLIIISAITLCVVFALSGLPIVLMLLMEWFVLAMALNSLAPETVLVCNASKSITSQRKLFDTWTFSNQVTSIADYYAVRMRTADDGNAYLQVELVGKFGATLTLNTFSNIAEAREFRAMITDFLKLRILLDPTNPEIA